MVNSLKNFDFTCSDIIDENLLNCVKKYREINDEKDISDIYDLTQFDTFNQENANKPENKKTNITIMDNIEQYIEDVKKHPENNKDITNLDNNYFYEENIIEVEDKENVETFTSPKFYIGEYAPTKLVDIPAINGVPDLKLESKALDAFTKLCNALRDNDTPIYAVSAYKSYDEQADIYSSSYNVQNKYVLKP